MAKISAPLLSLSASGGISNFLSVERRSNKQYIYDKKRTRGFHNFITAGFGTLRFGVAIFGYSGKISAKTFSADQTSRWFIFSLGWIAYKSLTPTDKMILSNEARELRLTGPNLFMRRWMKSHS